MRCLLACCLLARLASADPNTQQRADKLFTEGRELLNHKQPAEACAKFEEAIKLDPLAAGTMLNLGLCYEELAKYHTALSWYRKAQARASETNLPDHETAAKEHSSKLASLVPAVALEFKAPVIGARVRIDDETIEDKDFAHVEIDPGTHLLEVRAAGKKTAHIRFEVEAHHDNALTDKSITIELFDGEDAMIDPGKHRRYLAYGLGVAGVATLAFTLTYAIKQRINYDNDKSNPTAANSDAHRLRVVGSTSFVIGAALIGAATFLLVTSPDKRMADQTAWAPVVGADQIGLAVTGSF
jgi:tetratricopeptide (TPR) repeat protein